MTTTYPDRYPLCVECLALTDPVTGLSPRCPVHHTQPRRRVTLHPTATPERLPEELAIDSARAHGIPVPTAHDLRHQP